MSMLNSLPRRRSWLQVVLPTKQVTRLLLPKRAYAYFTLRCELFQLE